MHMQTKCLRSQLFCTQRAALPEQMLPRIKKLKSRKQIQQLWRDRREIAKELGYSPTILDHSPYSEDGLRKIIPYFHTYFTFCKRDWSGRTISEALAKEWCGHGEKDISELLKSGRLLINDSYVEPHYVFRLGDLLTTTTHRHEPPVLDIPVKVISKDENIIAVDKPPSLPTQATGLYCKNTLKWIIKMELGFGEIFAPHRLDRLTSGLVVIARNHKTASRLAKDFENRNIQKTYVALVDGIFPEEKVICEQPLRAAFDRISFSVVCPTGKSAMTEFQRINVLSGSRSLVLCKPRTGRNHQIRVHLQFLGFPICNDPIYNSTAFGSEKGKFGHYGNYNDMELARRLIVEVEKDVENSESNSKTVLLNTTSVSFDKLCPQCKCPTPYSRGAHQMIYLHALEYYSTSGWAYKTDWPKWAEA